MLQTVLSLASLISLLLPAALLAQSAALIEAAKTDGGKVVAYGSWESDAFDAV
jgi:hypothetical protein